IGGTVSAITGGKFANGARTGAMQYLLNGVWESVKEIKNNQVNRYRAARRAQALESEIMRLDDLFQNDRGALRQELELFGFVGTNVDLIHNYFALQASLNIELANANAVMTQGAPFYVSAKMQKIQGTYAQTSNLGQVTLGLWPYAVRMLSNPTYNYSYSCESVCKVQMFNIVD
ncbi:hypothetical protein, partial [Pseudoalteromonas rubra]